MKRVARLCIFTGLFALGMLVSSCSSSQSGDGVVAISKVNPYHLQPGMRVETDEEMIRFEQRHHLHGAVSSEEIKERYGYYYTVFWDTKQSGGPATVRFEYTQAATGPTRHVQEVEVASSKRKNATKFRVTGADYETNGVVTAWKASVISGGQTVAEYKSFLWK